MILKLDEILSHFYEMESRNYDKKTLLHNIHSQKWSDKKSLWQSENYENKFFCLKMIIMTKKSKLTKLKFWLKIITMI